MDSWEIHLEENKSLTPNFVFVNIEVTIVLLFKTNKKTIQTSTTTLFVANAVNSLMPILALNMI